MDIVELDKKLREMQAQVKAALPKLYQDLAGVGLRFVDDNFRNQGWEGVAWHGISRDGTILVDTAHLKNSFEDNVMADGVEIFSNSPYAAVHNEGFNGTVSVRTHQRSQFKKSGKKKKKTGTGMVRAHTRKANIKQRQFAPTDSSPSPTLEREATKVIENTFKPILKI